MQIPSLLVNDEWDRFAIANNSPDELAAKVIGTNLLEHISDLILQHLTEESIDKVRRERQPLSLRMRCDSPDTVRSFMMRISPIDDGQVEFNLELLEHYCRVTLDASP